jgi:hypothetical protein
MPLYFFVLGKTLVFATSTCTCALESMSDESITDILLSKHGHHDNHAQSLIHDEEFA